MESVPKRKSDQWYHRINTISGLDVVLGREIPTPTPVLGPWLAEGEIGLLHAPSGAGKTMVAMTLAVIAATGAEALHTSGGHAPVLYVDGEMGEAVFQERLKAICCGLGVKPEESAPFHLMQASACPPDAVTTFPYLDSENGPERLKAFVKANHIKLVVLDNLRFLARAIDENAAESFAEVNQFLLELASLGTAVLLIHHNNKGGNNGTFSGSTAIESPASVRVSIRKDSPSRSGNACVEVSVEKNRRGIQCPFTNGFKAELDQRSGEWAIIDTSPESKLLEFKARTEAFEFTSQQEAADAFDTTQRTIQRYVRSLKIRGEWNDDTWRECAEKAAELREVHSPDWKGEGDEGPYDPESQDLY